MLYRKITAFAMALIFVASSTNFVFAANTKQKFPSKFDLRDQNLVSSVKFQNPWGTCWGFGATAASEISILSELRSISPEYAEKFADPDSVDLSEMQLSWFATNGIPLDSDDPQAGEGIWVEGDYPLNSGGDNILATSVYSAGTGPIWEEEVPYRNHENVLTETFATYYADVYEDDPEKYYDWSVNEKYRDAYSFELEESFVLPSPAGADPNGRYKYDPHATEAIKEQLMANRGVSMEFCADTYSPDMIEYAKPEYINADNGSWAHYTYTEDGKPVMANHIICVVGWDDNYPKSNFLEGHQPPADGAWICKNSWGAADSEVPNKYDWGVDGSGYFYLSYYDVSLSKPESFNFDVKGGEERNKKYMFVDQYDLMPANVRVDLTAEKGNKYQFANVYEAEDDMAMRTIGIHTASENTAVKAEIYILNDNAKSPVDGEKVATVTGSFKYGGFHRMALKKPVIVEKGTVYSVNVTETDEKGLYNLPVSVGFSGVKTFNGGTIYSVAVVNEGESFFYDGRYWFDWAEVRDEVGSSVIGTEEEMEELKTKGYSWCFDNHPIKVYSDPVEHTVTDIDEDAWYAEAVEYVVVNDIMPVDGTIFSPDAAVDKAVLERSLDNMQMIATNAYDGVENNKPLTREDAAKIIYTCALERNYADPGEELADLDMADAKDVSSDAETAMKWMTAKGIIIGSSDKLLPKDEITKAQLAAMLMRFDKLELA
ncbi:MAG: S-layer homology domain-containing protein [Firmicutes bacterium]|nr:S-layer homology domain-containing protein [Bacillota bacterium]